MSDLHEFLCNWPEELAKFDPLAIAEVALKPTVEYDSEGDYFDRLSLEGGV